MAIVPSTREKPGLHPLARLIGSQLDLPWIASTANPRYGPNHRDFQPDWFTPTVPTPSDPIHVLLLDDTWTTGSRAQSLAYALKTTGAGSVVIVVLGRHIDPDYPPSRPLLDAIANPLLDVTRCAAETSMR